MQLKLRLNIDMSRATQICWHAALVKKSLSITIKLFLEWSWTILRAFWPLSFFLTSQIRFAHNTSHGLTHCIGVVDKEGYLKEKLACSFNAAIQDQDGLWENDSQGFAKGELSQLYISQKNCFFSLQVFMLNFEKGEVNSWHWGFHLMSLR